MLTPVIKVIHLGQKIMSVWSELLWLVQGVRFYPRTTKPQKLNKIGDVAEKPRRRCSTPEI